MTQSIKHHFGTLQLDADRYAYNTARLNGFQECSNIYRQTINPKAAVIEECAGVIEKDFSALAASSAHEARFLVSNIKDFL